MLVAAVFWQVGGPLAGIEQLAALPPTKLANEELYCSFSRGAGLVCHFSCCCYISRCLGPAANDPEAFRTEFPRVRSTE